MTPPPLSHALGMANVEYFSCSFGLVRAVACHFKELVPLLTVTGSVDFVDSLTVPEDAGIGRKHLSWFAISKSKEFVWTQGSGTKGEKKYS